MRAVNLIPSEAGRAGRRGGGSAYMLLGVLAVLVVGVTAYVLAHNQVVERRAELASVKTQAARARAAADASAPYRQFAALADARVDTVRQLGATRFDWHRAFADLARVIPDDVWLTSLTGTVTTGVSIEGAGAGTTGTIRGALPNPAIEMTGCTVGQDQVARLISRLRLLSGVVRVALSASEKQDTSDGGGGGGAGGDCRNGHTRFPQFGLVVFFAPLPTAPAPAQADPSAVGTATPSASTTPAPTAGSPAASAAATGNGNGSDAR